MVRGRIRHRIMGMVKLMVIFITVRVVIRVRVMGYP